MNIRPTAEDVRRENPEAVVAVKRYDWLLANLEGLSLKGERFLSPAAVAALERAGISIPKRMARTVASAIDLVFDLQAEPLRLLSSWSRWRP